MAIFVQRPIQHGLLHSFPTRRSSDLQREGKRLLRARRGLQVPRTGGGLARGPGLAGRSVGESAASPDRKTTRLNSSHVEISYAVFCLKKKKNIITIEES